MPCTLTQNQTDQTYPPNPSDINMTENSGAIAFSVRAGKVSPGLSVVFLLASLWAAKWLTQFFSLLKDPSHSANPGPELFIFALMGAAGLYCSCLMLWIMLGSERLIFRGNTMLHSNLWLFGMAKHRYNLRSVGTFQATSKECGAQAEGCCCTVSTVDYTLTFGHNGRRISVFSHLPRESKDWLKDRLNEAIAKVRSGSN